MGNGASHVAEVFTQLATTDEVRQAVKSIEAWQKAQDQNRGTAAAHASGALLYRVGGPDVVKRVVEAFYKKLYSNERLLVFLHDKDMVYLRAKQSAFMSWLFGSSNQTYGGKNLRIAHLRLIKQRGFSPEDFDVGINYFAEAMREMGSPEAIVNEVVAKIRPFQDVIFTPSSRDAEEEARWLAEDLAKGEQARLLQQQSGDRSRSASSQLEGVPPVTAATIAVDVTAAAGGSRPASSRVAQCPFSGARVSRPSSAAAAAAVTAAATAPGAQAQASPSGQAAGSADAGTNSKPSAAAGSAAVRPASASAPAAAGAATIPTSMAPAPAAAVTTPVATTTPPAAAAVIAAPAPTATAPAPAAAASTAMPISAAPASAQPSSRPASSKTPPPPLPPPPPPPPEPTVTAPKVPTAPPARAPSVSAATPSTAAPVAEPAASTPPSAAAAVASSKPGTAAKVGSSASRGRAAPSRAGTADIVGAFLSEIVTAEKSKAQAATPPEEDEDEDDVLAAALAELEAASTSVASPRPSIAGAAAPAPAAAALPARA